MKAMNFNLSMKCSEHQLKQEQPSKFAPNYYALPNQGKTYQEILQAQNMQPISPLYYEAQGHKKGFSYKTVGLVLLGVITVALLYRNKQLSDKIKSLETTPQIGATVRA